MKISTIGHNGIVTEAIVDDKVAELTKQLGSLPDLIIAHHTASALQPVPAALASHLPGSSFMGTSSCRGSVTENGQFGHDGEGFTLWAISDAKGAYGTALEEIGDDPHGAAQRALQAAVREAGRPGEAPDLIWMHAAPGHEEALIEAIDAITGGSVPITGGSSADETIGGAWTCFGGGKIAVDAISLAVFFPSTSLSWSFQSGYVPTINSGIVTKAEGRCIYEIDNLPAATVYNDWTNGLLTDAISSGDKSILATSTFQPLGREVGRIGDAELAVPYYALLHPESVGEELQLNLFAAVEEGARLTVMTGSHQSLLDRGGRVVTDARRRLPAGTDVAGGLLIYCAGAMLAVESQIESARQQAQEAFAGMPFSGAYTFGEQGRLLGGENCHGNLMVSAVVFGAAA